MYDWNGPPNGLHRARFLGGFEAGTGVLVEDLPLGLCWGHHGISLVNLSCLSHVC